jgi:hypothetical protein
MNEEKSGRIVKNSAKRKSEGDQKSKETLYQEST